MPTPNLASKGYTITAPGREAVVILEQASPFRLALDLRDAHTTRWFNPLTGTQEHTRTVKAGINEMRPTAGWTGRIVLQMKVASQAGT